MPVGNAGNEAYYTLLAFQKLMMAQTRLPDLLFKAPESYMSPAPYYTGFPQSASVNFSSYPSMAMPPPQAPFARPPHSRRESSSSSRRQSELFQPPTRTKSPASMSSPRRAPQAIRGASDDNRSRPASFGDQGQGGSGQYRGAAGGNGSPATREDPSLGGSVPNTARVPGRAPLPRSSTIFWDDAEYADADVSSQKGSLRDKQRLRQTQTTDTTPDRDSLTMRGRQPPPSAMRYNSGGEAVLNSTPSSRNVSWTEERGANSGPHGEYGREMSRDRRSVANGSSTALANGSRPTSQIKGAGSGSSTKLDSHSGSEGKGGGVGTGTKVVDGAKQETVKEGAGARDKPKEKEKGSKLKSEKSMRNVAGALARFWVG